MAAAREQMFAKKSYFITLTFKPAERASIFAEATRQIDVFPHRTQAGRLVSAAGSSVTKYLKRLRKAGFRFRYLIVAEPHRNGFPHYHGLIFDLAGPTEKPLTPDILGAEWSGGFSMVKGVRDANALRYVCKYLSKEKFARVRASKHFGDPSGAEGRCDGRSPERDPPLVYSLQD